VFSKALRKNSTADNAQPCVLGGKGNRIQQSFSWKRHVNTNSLGVLELASERDARVLENSYYWRRPPPFIRLLRRTGLGVAPLGSGAAPLVCRSNPVCPDNLTPRLRWMFVKLNAPNRNRFSSVSPTWSGLHQLTRHPYPESTVILNVGVNHVCLHMLSLFELRRSGCVGRAARLEQRREAEHEYEVGEP